MNATITFAMSQQDGSLCMVTHYEGGFDEGNPTHLAAKALGTKMGEIADPLGPMRDLTDEEVGEVMRQMAATEVAAG